MRRLRPARQSTKIMSIETSFGPFNYVSNNIFVRTSPASLRKGDAKHDHCNKTVDIYEDISSPEVTPETYGRPMTCWYRFRAFRGTPRDWILRIRFKKFKVGTLINATHCHNGYMQ
ncbi:uncharacterized protein LOC113469529, partial [Diaphorina citri]|uniref:Uncharacterized protein LOC113469529 n=1 Tax=Diaphorina citri TaxID=121845 RepID=A0A3Q0J3P6_DIACI